MYIRGERVPARSVGMFRRRRLSFPSPPWIGFLGMARCAPSRGHIVGGGIFLHPRAPVAIDPSRRRANEGGDGFLAIISEPQSPPGARDGESRAVGFPFFFFRCSRQIGQD